MNRQPYAQHSYPQYGAPYPLVAPRARSVNDILPASVPGLLGGLQLVLWLTIIGLEAGGLYYDPLRGTAYAGFWCSAIFFDTWISMFCYLCCGKTSGCAIYLLVQNIINMIVSIVLMAITSQFVNNPCSCFYSSYCGVLDWTDVIVGGGGLIGNNCLGKLPLLKGLLACSILMFLSNIAYIIAYIAISIWLCCKAPSSDLDTKAVYRGDANLVEINQQQPYYPNPARGHKHYSATVHPMSNPVHPMSNPVHPMSNPVHPMSNPVHPMSNPDHPSSSIRSPSRVEPYPSDDTNGGYS